MTTISEEVRNVLATGVQCDGQSLVITAHLERKLYMKTNDALVALGGKWIKKNKCHLFEGRTAAEAVASVLEKNGYVNQKDEFELFETPVALAERMAEMLDIKAGQTVLEPSAGYGRLALAAAKYTHARNIYCIEIQLECCKKLIGFNFESVRCNDFLKEPVPPETLPDGTEKFFTFRPFRHVIMNPPFSRNQDIAHVRHAAEFLAPGGNLVAIMSPHHTFADDKASVEFRAWLDGDAFKETYCESLIAGTFKESGTMVSGILVLMTGKKG